MYACKEDATPKVPDGLTPANYLQHAAAVDWGGVHLADEDEAADVRTW